MTVLDILKPLGVRGGAVRTNGLDAATLLSLREQFPEITEAAKAAAELFASLQAEFADLLDADEEAQINATQPGFLNLYADEAVNPYVASTPGGPRISTVEGRVRHDSAGYSTLAFGHPPSNVIDTMSKPQVMANVMSPSPSHRRI